MLPYKLDPTNDFLTSRASLLATGQLLESLNLAERIDHYFPLPKSNGSYPPSVFIQHEGSFHLDDVRHLQDDNGLRDMLNLKTLSYHFR